MYADKLCKSLMENRDIHTDDGQKKSNYYKFTLVSSMLIQASQKVVSKAMLLACKCNCINGKQTKQNQTNYLFKIHVYYKQHTIYHSSF